MLIVDNVLYRMLTLQAGGTTQKSLAEMQGFFWFIPLQQHTDTKKGAAQRPLLYLKNPNRD